MSGLVVRYGEIEALRGLSLSVDAGEVVTLLGSNGAGKSTTLRAISGLLKPAAGEHPVRRQVDRRPGARGDRAARHRARAGRPARVPRPDRARENIMLGASNRGRVSKPQLMREADEMFDLFPDIRPFADALGWTLSGGQQQMVAVARGLMAKPRLLLLDEPSLGLAPVIVQKVFAIIAEIRAPRHDGAAGGAERPHGAVGGRPRLRAGDRAASGLEGKPGGTVGQRRSPRRLSRRPQGGRGSRERNLGSSGVDSIHDDPADLRDLKRAVALLEKVSVTIQIADAIGSPLEWALKKLPASANASIQSAVKGALQKAVAGALLTLRDRGRQQASTKVHKAGAVLSGFAGGFFGLAGTLVEIPVTTMLMMRSVADVARSEGFDLADLAVQAACVEVFAMGGRSERDDAAESGYYATRLGLAEMTKHTAAELARMAAQGGARRGFTFSANRRAACSPG